MWRVCAEDFMILVTGGTGHVGIPLVEALLRKGEKVRVLTVDEEAEINGAEMVYGNILDQECVRRAADGAVVVYHLAAVVDYSPSPRKAMYKVNVEGTRNMLEYSKAGKFIYLSTTSVYGKRMRENPATESTAYDPHSFYGKTKEAAEKLVLKGGGMVLRSPVIYGKGFDDGFGFVLSRIEKGRMPIIGSGENRIQWIHIRDLVQALLLADEKGRGGEVYLVAGKEARTQRELFSMLARHLGAKEPDRKVARLVALALAHYAAVSAGLKGKKPLLTAGHIDRIASDRIFDISKSRRELGFDPKVGYEEGAEEIVREYLRARNDAEDSRLIGKA